MSHLQEVLHLLPLPPGPAHCEPEPLDCGQEGQQEQGAGGTGGGGEVGRGGEREEEE